MSGTNPSRDGGMDGLATSCPLTELATGATVMAHLASQPPWLSLLLHPKYPRFGRLSICQQHQQYNCTAKQHNYV